MSVELMSLGAQVTAAASFAGLGPKKSNGEEERAAAAGLGWKKYYDGKIIVGGRSEEDSKFFIGC